MTKNMKTRLRRKLKVLVDTIGDSKIERDMLIETIAELVGEAKDISKKLSISQINGDDYQMLIESFSSQKTDWKALAMSYKPSKARINKYTKKNKITRLKTFEL